MCREARKVVLASAKRFVQSLEMEHDDHRWISRFCVERMREYDEATGPNALTSMHNERLELQVRACVAVWLAVCVCACVCERACVTVYCVGSSLSLRWLSRRCRTS
jgi:hypothetical protein